MKKSKVLKNLTDRRAYKLLTTIDQDQYSEDFWVLTKDGEVKHHLRESGRKKFYTCSNTECTEHGSITGKQNINKMKNVKTHRLKL